MGLVRTLRGVLRLRGLVRGRRAAVRHAVVGGLVVAVVALLVYGVVFVVLPAEELRAGRRGRCVVLAARLACWRRAVLSFSEVERGHHECWLVRAARLPDNATRAAEGGEEFESMVRPVHVLGSERDGCVGYAACGNVTWDCVTVPGRTGFGRLRWRYPVKRVASTFSVAGGLCAVLLALGLQERRKRGGVEVDGDSEQDEEEEEEEEEEDDEDARTVWSSGFGSVARGEDGRVEAYDDMQEDPQFSKAMTTDEIIESYEKGPGFENYGRGPGAV